MLLLLASSPLSEPSIGDVFHSKLKFKKQLYKTTQQFQALILLLLLKTIHDKVKAKQTSLPAVRRLTSHLRIRTKIFFKINKYI